MKKSKVSILSFILILVGCLVIISFKSVRADSETQVDVEEIKVTNIQNNYTFTPKSKGKWIVIKPQLEGILHTWSKVYDSNKKPLVGIKNIDEDDNYITNVKASDIYYIKMPEVMSDNITIYGIVVLKDNIKTLAVNDKWIQSGQNKNIYQNFNMKNRGSQTFSFGAVNTDGGDVRFYIQKKEGKKWYTTTRILKLTNGKTDEFTLSLKAGDYRIVTKADKEQIYMFQMSNTIFLSNYQTKKSKAQTIKLGKTNTNIYTASEKASRWYKVSRSATKKNHYVKLSVNNNSGNVKYTIYKKGRSKSLKSYTLSGIKSKTYRLNNGKGTYYVKVSKSGSKMNGQYSIQYK